MNVIACSTSPDANGNYYLAKDSSLFYPKGWNSVAALNYPTSDLPYPYYLHAFDQLTSPPVLGESHTCAAMNSYPWVSNTIRFQVDQKRLHGDNSQVQEYLSTIQTCVDTAITQYPPFAVILSMNAKFTKDADPDGSTVTQNTYLAWENLAPLFSGDLMVMFELLNEPGYTNDALWQSDFQVLIDVLRTYAPSNVLIVPGLGSSQNFFPSDPGLLPTGTNIAFGVHGYLSIPDFQDHNFKSVYGRIAQVAPVVMTEVKGACATQDWPTAPADFTAMLEYNSSANIGVTAWVFDDLSDPKLVAVTALGSPNEWTDQWTCVPTNCNPGVRDHNNSLLQSPGDLYSDWMLGR